MGLENLKSAYSNIKLPKLSIEKSGKEITDLSTPVIKKGSDINIPHKKQILDMKSEYSIDSYRSIMSIIVLGYFGI